MAAPKYIKGLEEVFGLYDGFILDLWGVVHDGVSPFPDTIPTLTQLKKAKKKIWLLSNAPRRCYIVAEKLTEMGVTSDLYDGLLTSGEMSRQILQDSLLEKWGRHCFHIGRPNDDSLFEGLDVTRVGNPSAADFVLNSGILDFSDPLEKYVPVLKECSKHNLPMLCANPDKVVHIEEKLVICAGTLADAYAEMDGEVVSIGKPYRSVYSHCLKELGVPRVLAVGDSMLTDIAGATGAGLDSVLVTSGIHREEFAKGDSRGILALYPYQPTYVLDKFSM